MTAMIRKQVYLKHQQVKAIKKRASELRVSVSEIIRRAIDNELRGSVTHFYPNSEAKEALRKFLLTYQPAQLEGPPYRFNRDEIYEERLDRYHADLD
jgi:hypothetical protein